MSEQEATESHEETPPVPESQDDANKSQEDAEREGRDKKFDATYVAALRRESAEYRTRAQRADTLHSRLLDSVIREGTAGILNDSDDVWRDAEVDDFCDDDGMPDVEKVRARARELAEAKPHLAYKRVSGDVDQGARSEPQTVSLTGLLRDAAG